MKSSELGLPLFYQELPEYFDSSTDVYNALEKNCVIEKIMHKYNVKSILDLTCGTGSQVFYLDSKGYSIIGVDFSPGLIKIAQQYSIKEARDILFLEGDMRTFYRGEFDAVITIDNAIGHLVKDDFEKALKNIWSNLKDGGMYVFDILNLEAMTDEIVEADNIKMTHKRIATDGTVIHNKRHSLIDRNAGHFISENNFTLDYVNGESKNISNKCTLQIYTMSELQDILKKNGFQLVEQYKIDAYTFARDEAGTSIMTVAKKV